MCFLIFVVFVVVIILIVISIVDSSLDQLQHSSHATLGQGNRERCDFHCSCALSTASRVSASTHRTMSSGNAMLDAVTVVIPCAV
jgi:hypothetical protein